MTSLAALQTPAGARRHPRLAEALCVAALLVLAFLAVCSPAAAVISGEFGLQRRAKATTSFAPLQYHGGPVLHHSDAYSIYWDPTGTYRGDWKEAINGYLQNVGADSGSGNVFSLDGQYADSGGGAVNSSTFRGSYTDTNPYPTSGDCSEPAAFACLTDAQIRAELQRVIASGALPGATGPGVYYLLTPPGVTVCTDEGGNGNCSNSTGSPPNGICGYHSAINPASPSPVVYAVQPWVAGDAGLFIENAEPLETSEPTDDVFACQAGSEPLEEPNQLPGLNPWGNYAAGLADVIINDLSIEQSNIVVDPLLNGWYQTATKAEQSDMCQWDFGPDARKPQTPNAETHAASLANEQINNHGYFVQWAFNSTWLTSGKGYTCWQGDSFKPHFTAPNPVNAGDVIGFDGTESLITLQAATEGLPADEPYVAPSYAWDFGDGSSVSGTHDASVFHTYQYGGDYKVKLTVTDSGHISGSYEETITVVGPARPTTGGSSGANASAAPSATPAGTTVATTTTPPSVAATQVISTHSLASALRNGLVVRYSVNGRAAGRFEVLLAKSVAQKLGLKGATATGLAKGTPAQIVIAKAILVTTKAGHSSYRIKFSKATAAKLRKLHKVSLMIRMVVHNASSPIATTVLSTATLSR